MILNNKNIENLYEMIPKQIVVKEDLSFSPINVVGCDVSYKEKAKVSCVVFNIIENKVIEEVTFEKKIPWDYIPGKFALRELPLIEKALLRISKVFDCIIVDGHGIAHPKKAGLACFVGVLFDLPTIGCAKSLLVGDYVQVDRKRGKWASIFYNGEKVGEAICTKDGTKPIFFSPGHKIGFESGRKLILNLTRNSKYPEPLRIADRNTRKY
ncbi:MAG: endonuclease V [candidate division WOR-3 bacterium]